MSIVTATTVAAFPRPRRRNCVCTFPSRTMLRRLPLHKYVRRPAGGSCGARPPLASAAIAGLEALDVARLEHVDDRPAANSPHTLPTIRRMTPVQRRQDAVR